MLINNEKEQSFTAIINSYEKIIQNLHFENATLLEATRLKSRIIAKQNLQIKFLSEMRK